MTSHLRLYVRLQALFSSLFEHFPQKRKNSKYPLHIRGLLNRYTKLKRKLGLFPTDPLLKHRCVSTLDALTLGIEHLRKKQEQRAATHFSSNPHLFHQYVRKLSHKPITNDSMMLPSTDHTVNLHTIAQAFNQYFQSLQLPPSVSTSFSPSSSLPSPESPLRAFITLTAFPLSSPSTIATITKSLPQC